MTLSIILTTEGLPLVSVFLMAVNLLLMLLPLLTNYSASYSGTLLHSLSGRGLQTQSGPMLLLLVHNIPSLVFGII